MFSTTDALTIDAPIPLTSERGLPSSEQLKPVDVLGCDHLAMLGEMTSSLAHELNQPLTAICTYIDCCRRYANPPQTDKLMAVVEKIAAQAQQASDILSRVRGAMRRQQPSREQVEANDLVLQALRLSDNLIRKHRVSVDLSLLPSLPLVETDPVQMRQVLQNLIVNSLEATVTNNCRPSHIRISTSVTSSGDVTIDVCDNGQGFSEADGAHLFEPFLRLSRKA